MKAILKASGKIVSVEEIREMDDDNGMSYRCGYRNLKTKETYNSEELLFGSYEIKQAEIWEERRYEIAKEMLPTIQSVNSQVGLRCGNLSSDKEVVETAIRFADELIKQLKEEL